MARYKEKRDLKDSRGRVVTYAHIARGKIHTIEKKKFIVKSSVKKKFEGLDGKVVERNINHVIENNPSGYSVFEFDKPDFKYEVILKYRDKKSKYGEYKNPERNLPAEIVTPRGHVLYRAEKEFLEQS